MNNKNYTETEVVKSLSQKSDLHIRSDKKVIEERFGKTAKKDVGIGSKGKISFLVNFCGYHHTWVD